MSKELASSQIAEIKKLHQELCGITKAGLKLAIRIGELLAIQKASMRHGDWSLWVSSQTLPFGERQARNYLSVYENRQQFDTAGELNFNQALSKLRKVKQIQNGSKNTDSRVANQSVGKKDDNSPKSELSPEEQALADIKAFGSAPPAADPPKPPPAATRTAPAKPAAPAVIRDAKGTPIPVPAMPFWERKQEVQDVLTAITRLKSFLKDKQDAKDRLFGSHCCQSALQSLSAAYTTVSNVLPYAVCLECEGHPELNGCPYCSGTGLMGKFTYDKYPYPDKRALRERLHADYVA